jgi:hypothetical protein
VVTKPRISRLSAHNQTVERPNRPAAEHPTTGGAAAPLRPP